MTDSARSDEAIMAAAPPGRSSGCLDLMLAVLWATALVAAVTLTDSVALRTTLGVPLMLLVAGHAVLRGAGIRSATLAEHLTFAVAASIGTCVIGGLALHLVHGLTPVGWAIWFWIVVALAMLAAAMQRTTAWMPPSGRSRFGIRHGFALSATALVAAGAILLAVHQERNNRQFAFTELWLVPTGGAGQFTIGVRSGESETSTYDVEITLDGRTLALHRDVTLDPGAEWHHDLQIQQRDTWQKARARLVRRADSRVYRHVSVTVPPLSS